MDHLFLNFKNMAVKCKDPKFTQRSESIMVGMKRRGHQSRKQRGFYVLRGEVKMFGARRLKRYSCQHLPL